MVNSAGTGLRFINYTNSDLNIEYFNQLADVPSSYIGKANYLVMVANNEDGLEYLARDEVLPDQSAVAAGSYKYPEIVINKKGVITSIHEGKPFVFDAFDNNRLLVGDGSEIPAQVALGKAGQTLNTNDDRAPTWVYLNRLRDSYGNSVLVIDSPAADNTSTLFITTNNEQIWLRPGSSQTFVIGSGNPISLNGNTSADGIFTAQLTSEFNGIATFNRNIVSKANINTTGNITAGGTITATEGISSEGTITATGNISTSSNLVVAHNIQVDGQSILNGSLAVTGAITGADNLTITGTSNLGNTSIDGNLIVSGVSTFNSKVIIADELSIDKEISAADGIEISPGTGKITVINVDPQDYEELITDDNDLITKRYYQDHLPVAQSYYVKTNSYTVSSSQVQIPVPNGSTVMEINFEVLSNFNSSARLQVIDSEDFILFDPNDSPYLDSEEIKIFASKNVTSSNYLINIDILDYQYGEGSIFITYFEGNS